MPKRLSAHDRCREKWNGCSVFNIPTTTWNTIGDTWWGECEKKDFDMNREGTDREHYTNQKVTLIRQQGWLWPFSFGPQHRIILISEFEGKKVTLLLSTSHDEREQRVRFSCLRRALGRLKVAMEDPRMNYLSWRQNWTEMVVCPDSICRNGNYCGQVKALQMAYSAIQKPAYIKGAGRPLRIAIMELHPGKGTTAKKKTTPFEIIWTVKRKDKKYYHYKLAWDVKRDTRGHEYSGRVIRVWRGAYWHYGILSNEKYSNKYSDRIPKVWHFQGDGKAWKIPRKWGATVRHETLCEFFDGDTEVELITYQDLRLAGGYQFRLPRFVAAQRAFFAESEPGYSLLAGNGGTNCEGLASSCVTGVTRSQQVSKVTGGRRS